MPKITQKAISGALDPNLAKSVGVTGVKSSPCKVGLGCILTALPSERKPAETRLRRAGGFSTELLPSVQLLLTCHGGDVILSHQILSVCWRGVIQECVIIVLVAAGARAASKDVLLSDAFPVASWLTNGLCFLCRCCIPASISHTVRSSACIDLYEAYIIYRYVSLTHR